MVLLSVVFFMFLFYYDLHNDMFVKNSLFFQEIINLDFNDLVLSGNFALFNVIMMDSFNYVVIESFLKSNLSCMDVLLQKFFIGNSSVMSLFNCIIFDYFVSINSFLSIESEFFVDDFNNVFITYLFYNPELVLSMWDFKLVYLDYFLSINVSTLSLYNSLVFNNFDYFYNMFTNLKLIFFFIIVSSLIIDFFKPSSLTGNRNFFIQRMYFYFYSLSKENRLNFNFFMPFILFSLFFWIISLSNYDESSVGFIELFHLFIIYLFLFIIIYLLFKYSTHYFSFLEASVIDGKSSSILYSQFIKDMSNTFALFLRFFLLLFRLNIYDGLDDFLDSYYIFFCDFDDDHYYDESFIYLNSTFFFVEDNHDDADLFSLKETDLLENLFDKYFIILGKFFMFWFFILEELGRVGLALYITYLIIFEVHSVNCSYNEDNFFKESK